MEDHNTKGSNGKAPNPNATLLAPEPAPPPPGIDERAQACVRFVQKTIGIALDFTPETLSVLDHYVRISASQGQERPQALLLVAQAIAAYLGEVFRHHYDAWWHAPNDDDPWSWELRFREVYLALTPFAVSYHALGLGDPESEADWLTLDDADRDELHERLAILPPVSEEEYWLPSTRFDVVQILIDHSKALAEQRGLGDVHFHDEDY